MATNKVNIHAFSVTQNSLSSANNIRAITTDSKILYPTKKYKHVFSKPIAVVDHQDDVIESELENPPAEERNKTSVEFNTVCQVVANGDGKLDNNIQFSDPKQSFIFNKLNDFYHSRNYQETFHLKYLRSQRGEGNLKYNNDLYINEDERQNNYNEKEEEELVLTLRKSLEDAGFELMGQRDLDLCEALNAGYLLRLSIVPDTKKQDPFVGFEFFPDLMKNSNNDDDDDDDKTGLLFDGRVLVFRRGYSSEVSRGRLILPKLDYLQASLVQRSVSFISDFVFKVERSVTSRYTESNEFVKQSFERTLRKATNTIPNDALSNLAQKAIGLDENDEKKKLVTKKGKKSKRAKFTRYGGNKIRFVDAPDESDALIPFLVCERKEETNIKMDSPINKTNDNLLVVSDGRLSENNNLYAGLESGEIKCGYDSLQTSPIQSTSYGNRFVLLDRVSISNLVNFFSKEGRRKLVKSFFSESELVEPTYEEVVVIWRPLPEKVKKQPKLKIPTFVYDVAEVFAVDDRLPIKPKPPQEPKPLPLEVRIFNDVPMGNLLAVLPKTRLIFRPADAFLFDLISAFTLLAVLATQRYDNPKLDILALISVSLWLLRTVLRYSNKLARYDLLVNKFLVSKLSEKGAGALQYILSEASKQRATRVGLVYTWILDMINSNDNKSKEETSPDMELLSCQQLERNGNAGINQLFKIDNKSYINIAKAIDDLKELNLIECTEDGRYITKLNKDKEAMDILRENWVELFEKTSNDDSESLTN